MVSSSFLVSQFISLGAYILYAVYCITFGSAELRGCNFTIFSEICRLDLKILIVQTGILILESNSKLNDNLFATASFLKRVKTLDLF